MQAHRRLIPLCLVACLVAAMVSPVSAAEVELGSDLMSAFIFRGAALNDEPVLQVWGTVSAECGFSLTAWGNVDLTDQMGTGGDLSEVDLVAAWAGELDGSLFLEAGYIQYLYLKIGDPETGEVIAENERTGELYLELALKAPLSPAVTVFRDIGEVGGLYATVGVDHPVALAERTELELHAHLGVADARHSNAYFGVETSGLNDLTASASLRFAPSERLALAVSAGVSWLLDEAVRESEARDYRAWGGLHLSYTF